MLREPLLQQIFHALSNMEFCRAVDNGSAKYPGHNPEGLSRVGPMIGWLDWHTELVCLIQEAKRRGKSEQLSNSRAALPGS